MKTSKILRYIFRNTAIVLTAVAMFAVWTALLSVLMIPTGVYILVVIPICWVSRSKVDYNRPIAWVADLLFDRFFDWMEWVTSWIDEQTYRE